MLVSAMVEDLLRFRKPFDAHLHIRQGEVMRAVLPVSADSFFGGIVMPNTKPPIRTLAESVSYEDEILQICKEKEISFTALMTAFLTDETSPDVAFPCGGRRFAAVKWYPAGGTTNSTGATSDLSKVRDVLHAMSQTRTPLLIHGECTHHKGDPVEPGLRESIFAREVLPWILDEFHELRISLEHISTKEMAEVILEQGGPNLVGTVAPQHLLETREGARGKADLTCMPVIKDEEDRQAIRDLIRSGCEWVHLGTDSAPHLESTKTGKSPAFGCFSAPHAIPLYLEAFAEMDCLELFEAFASVRGPRFFGLKPSKEMVRYEREDWQIESMLPVSELGSIRPLGFRTPWEEERFGEVNRTLRFKRVE